MLLAQLTTDLIIYSILVLSLNFIIGKTSVWSVGHLAFFGIGAVLTAAILKSVHSPTAAFALSVVAAAGLSGVLSFVIGVATFRLRQDFFVILSIAFAELVLATSITWKGPAGIDHVPRPDILGVNLQNDWTMITVVLVPFGLFVFFMAERFSRSRLERVCALIRTSEEAAVSLQLSPMYYRIGCFCMGSIVAAICGVLFTCFARSTDPSQLLLQRNILLFSAVLLGGLNSTLGSILGGVLLVALPRLLEAAFFNGTFGALYAAQVNQLLFGAVLLLTVRFLPRGLAGQSGLYDTGDQS